MFTDSSGHCNPHGPRAAHPDPTRESDAHNANSSTHARKPARDEQRARRPLRPPELPLAEGSQNLQAAGPQPEKTQRTTANRRHITPRAQPPPYTNTMKVIA